MHSRPFASIRGLIILLAFLHGCGYVGDPLPPALNIPVPVTDLRAVQRGDRILIEFTAPALTTDKLIMPRISGAELRINEEAIEVKAAGPGPVTVQLPVARYVNRRIRLQARTASHKMKWSDLSAPLDLDVVEPVAVPEALKAIAVPEGVRLSWNGEPRKFLIQRLAPGEKEFTSAGEADKTEWTDSTALFGQTYQYRVQAVSGKAESEWSPPVRITPIDTFPPPVPENVTGVAGIGTIELTWDRSPASDIAGYRVYRGEGNDPRTLTRIGEVQLFPGYSDKTIQSGALYRYAITALDSAGNESKFSAPIEVRAP
jgi:hypothetical protein